MVSGKVTFSRLSFDCVGGVVVYHMWFTHWFLLSLVGENEEEVEKV